MIIPIKAEKSYKIKNGDFIFDMCKPKNGMELYLDENEEFSEKVIPLALVDVNPWRALDDLNIDASELMTIYSCPHTATEYFPLIPVALLVNDIEAYRNCRFRFGPDYTLDWEFHKHMYKERVYEINDIQKIMLGTGYTSYTTFYDGHGRIEKKKINLDNGDALLTYFWEWYNK